MQVTVNRDELAKAVGYVKQCLPRRAVAETAAYCAGWRTACWDVGFGP